MRNGPLATVLALIAFAANSVLCRLALGHGAIDPASFATLRLAAGAGALLVLSRSTRSEAAPVKGSWLSAGTLFLYATCFSFAYSRLSAGTGALVLFGSVQLMMMIGALRAGEKPRALQWIGSGMAFAGLIYLVLPGLAAPSMAGATLMVLAGLSWGSYSLLGRRATHPIAQTTSNFVRSLPLALAVSAVSIRRAHLEPGGVLLAVLSGAVASALGYVLWYTALRGLTASRAAIVQLSVPLLAAAGGVMFLSETISLHLTLAALLILGGLALALVRLPMPHSPPSQQR